MNEREAEDAQNYRHMAARCREMADRTRWPEPLLRRAEAFEFAASEIEQGRGFVSYREPISR